MRQNRMTIRVIHSVPGKCSPFQERTQDAGEEMYIQLRRDWGQLAIVDFGCWKAQERD